MVFADDGFEARDHVQEKPLFGQDVFKFDPSLVWTKKRKDRAKPVPVKRNFAPTAGGRRLCPRKVEFLWLDLRLNPHEPHCA